MIRATAGQYVNAQMVDATTGGAFIGTVTVYVTLDNGTQTIGSVGSGLATAKGNGVYQYAPALLETDAALCAFTFIGTGAVPQTLEFPTITAAQQSALTQVTGGVTVLTVRDLLIAALQDLNEMGASDTPTPEDLQVAFNRLNDFIDDLRNDALAVFTNARTTWPLTAGVASYTLGLTGTVVMPRPINPQAILNIGFQDTAVTPTYERLLGPPLTEDAYAAIPFKTLTAVYPTAFYYNPTSALGTLWVFPIPTAATLQGVIYAPTPVSEFGTLNDTITLVPGFRRFFRNQLVCELASAFEKAAPQTAKEAARESLAKIKRSNLRLYDLSFDPALAGGDGPSNVYTG